MDDICMDLEKSLSPHSRPASPSSSPTSLSYSQSNRQIKKIQLTESQLKTAFSMLDLNQDGFINEDEFRTMLSNLGIPANDQLIEQMIQDIGDGNRVIDERVFRDLMTRYSEKVTVNDNSVDDDLERDLKAAFEVFDNDNKGYITRDGLRAALHLMGEKFTEPYIDNLLEQIDCDKDGQISYQQFIRILT